MSDRTMDIDKQEERSEAMQPYRQVRRTLKPRIDLYEADEVIMLVADLPGVSEEDIDITLEQDRLTIKGSATNHAPEGFRRVYSEFGHGDYERSFILSNKVDRANIEARFDNGVLTLSLPKAETAKSRKITLQSAN